MPRGVYDRSLTPAERYWSMVNKRGPLHPHDPRLGRCWLWTGCTDQGYGVFGVGGKSRRAHRFGWELSHGPIPEGMVLLHTCDVRTCQRHLRLGTKLDNMVDQIIRGRRGRPRPWTRVRTPSAPKLTRIERYWSMVNKRGPVPAHCPSLGACWVWTGGVDQGYGYFCRMRAHRFGWTLHSGPIPSGLVVMHRCDNPRCQNPAHLTLGTRRENAQDMAAKGRHWLQRNPELSSLHAYNASGKARRRGEQNGAAKLTAKNIRSIRSLRTKGHTLVFIGNRFGVDFRTVSKIVNAQRWQHVNG